MKTINQLIQEYCPNGVEYKQLREIASIKRGERVTKKELLENGTYAVISGGSAPMGYYKDYNRLENTITISKYGSAGYVDWQFEKFWANDVCYTILPSKQINNRYLYHFLKHSQNLLFYLRIDAVPAHLPQDRLASIKIPFPHLVVQEAIANFLDKFTSLTAELQAELQARQTQYSYYRDYLLDYKRDDDNLPSLHSGKLSSSQNKQNNSSQKTTENIYCKNSAGKQHNVKWMKLGDIGNVCMCKRIFKKETSSIGDVPFYKIGTFGKKADSYISFEKYKLYKEKYNYPKKGDILISASGTIGRTIVFDGKPSYFQDSNIVWIDNDESIVTNQYLKYYYQLNPWFVESGGTIKRLYNNNIIKTKIPVPPIEEQERIVAILDKFDTLVNDMSEGIPAEIEARQKQYEYYRDKLLSFEDINKDN